MSAPTYAIPGSTSSAVATNAPESVASERQDSTAGARSVAEVLEGSQVEAVL